MSRVARCLRTTVALVLLFALASTAGAGAAEQATSQSVDASAVSNASLPDAPRSSTSLSSESDDATNASSGSAEEAPADTDAAVDDDRPDGSGGGAAETSEAGSTSANARAGGRGADGTAAKRHGAGRAGDGTSGRAGRRVGAANELEARPVEPPRASQIEEAAWQRFDQALAARLASPNLAASAAVSIDGQRVHTATFGERVRGQATQPAHRFRLASISKVFTAVATLRLVQQGRLQLDEPVGRRIAKALGVNAADGRTNGITVRQLLNHTSGFARYDTEFFRGGSQSCIEAASTAYGRSLNGAPSASFSYSNMNYCVLGLLLEDVTGKPYDQVVADEVLAPLGIEGMRVAGTFDIGPGDVRHPAGPGRNYMETLGAAGAWVASPTDVVTLMDSLDPANPGWHPLSNRLLAQMKAPATRTGPGAPAGQWYGLGLMVFSDGSWGHTGTLEGTHTMTVARPDGVTWAVTVSGETPSNSSDLRRIVDDALVAAGLG